MIEVITLTKDQACGGCTLTDRARRQADRSEPIRYFRLYIYNDPQYRPSIAVCEDCARAILNGLKLVLGEHT